MVGGGLRGFAGLPDFARRRACGAVAAEARGRGSGAMRRRMGDEVVGLLWPITDFRF